MGMRVEASPKLPIKRPLGFSKTGNSSRDPEKSGTTIGKSSKKRPKTIRKSFVLCFRFFFELEFESAVEILTSKPSLLLYTRSVITLVLHFAFGF
uniref:Uncharacterized protein n=1 Tax=Solanum tuberosum TaxID=4113 RepID=M1C8E6_SOLTU